jgi:hypothetical protein
MARAPKPDPLPRDLRRRANRAATPRKRPPDNLIAAAQRGLLTRSNTKPGTKGRQAADAVVYQSRVADRAPGETARQRLGVVPTERSMPALFDEPPRWVDLDNLSRAEARRVARYNSLTGQLTKGKLSPAAFRRRVSSWRPFRDERFLSDPDAALALLEVRRTSDEELFYYERGRRP